MKRTDSSHLISDIVRTDVDERRTGLLGKVRRSVTSCVVDTDIDTMAVVVFVMEFVFIVALMWLQERVIVVPPPFFDGFWIRLPAACWSGVIVGGMMWQVYGWQNGKDCARRNGAIFSSLFIFLMCGPMFLKAPILATIVFVVNIFQAIVAARLIGQCSSDD